jgi:hypothetical protein
MIGDFTARVMRHQIKKPDMEVQDLLALSDRSLLHIAGHRGSSQLASQDDQLL